MDDTAADILKDLNPIQKEAVLHLEGPLLVLAGAGSGKTRLLTYKIAYLIKEKAVSPYTILAITFTNKAAAEMKTRVEALLGERLVKDMWVSTFHSACNRILRAHSPALGYGHNFVIYDERDSYQVVRDCLKELDIDPKTYPPGSFRAVISNAKSRLVEPGALTKTAANEYEELIAKVYELYQKRLKDSGAVDFDDLINLTVRLFRTHPNVLEKYRRKFKYVLVDEYQDTNPAQYQLIKLLASGGKNITVVGDEDQSIYAFRMADIRNILEFERDFPGTTLIKMEQNYRSTKKILEAANYVISHNINRKGKTLWTANAEGGIVATFAAANEIDEAGFITREIEQLVEVEGQSFADCAVFYRTHAQSRVLEEALLRVGIPYRIVGALRFYERREIKDTLAYLWVIYNPASNLQLRRILNVPKRGIGERTLSRIETFAARRGLSLFQALQQVKEINLSGRAEKPIVEFVHLIEEMSVLKEDKSFTGLIKNIWKKTGYTAELEAERTPQARARIENLEELISVARNFETGATSQDLGEFLQQISLITPVDEAEGTEDGISLMTLHSAKGLEFANVFIVGLEEGIFPHSRAMGEEAQLEEERRLCYVGMTRAKERLYLTYAWSRMLYGQRLTSRPSRFVAEIPDHLLNRTEAPVRTTVGMKNVYPGEVVYHAQWGEGLVIDVEGSDENAIATINFPSVGIKRVLLVYTPLELKLEHG